MHEFRPGLVTATEAAGRQAVNDFDLFRPDIDVGLDVPFEGTYMGRPLCDFQALLTLAKRVPRPLLLVNIRGDADDPNNIVAGVADRGSAYAHPTLPTTIASLVNSLEILYGLTTERPFQRIFMVLKGLSIRVISDPIPMQFIIRRRNHRMADHLLESRIGHDDPPAVRIRH